MRIVVTGGGTAGHVIPLLAVASEIKKNYPDTTIRYVGNYGDTFARLAEDSSAIDGSWRIYAGKFRRYHGLGKLFYIKHPSIILRNIRDLFLFLLGIVQSLWLLVWWRPTVLFVKGGFVGLPVGLAAVVLRIPIVTHDSDTVPGLTNRILSRHAKYMAVAMPPQYYKYPDSKIRYTGLPIRDDFTVVTPDMQRQAREQLGVPKDAFIIAVFGGSLGAVRLNEAIATIVPELMEHNNQRWLLHQTGSYHYQNMIHTYSTLPPSVAKRIKTWPFLDNMHVVSAAADVIVSRAGSSIHELSAQRKPVILVPNPVLTGAHQTINARVLSERGAAVVVSEQDIIDTDSRALLHAIEYLEAQPKQRAELAEALGSLAVPNAAQKIVDVIIEAVHS